MTTPTPLDKLVGAVAARNRAAAKVLKLEDALYDARCKLEIAEAKVYGAQAKAGATIRYEVGDWVVVSKPAPEPGEYGYEEADQ